MKFFSKNDSETNNTISDNLSSTGRFQAEKRVISDKVSTNLENIFRLNK